jgi:hypothetical protein
MSRDIVWPVTCQTRRLYIDETFELYVLHLLVINASLHVPQIVHHKWRASYGSSRIESILIAPSNERCTDVVNARTRSLQENPPSTQPLSDLAVERSSSRIVHRQYPVTEWPARRTFCGHAEHIGYSVYGDVRSSPVKSCAEVDSLVFHQIGVSLAKRLVARTCIIVRIVG